ncbi:MAG: class I mannose-6-phosphate isomerase [Myxococcales bacterium]|nr:class I mannose-6-phosphate isomerase [Myxococcales bacterium]
MISSFLPPLVFTPVVQARVWGGRALERFGKILPAAVPCGESWEVADLPGMESQVATGELAARSLRDLSRERAEELLGDAPMLYGRFPVLFKLLDVAGSLSLQVHPDEAACRELSGEARPKDEAWYVIEAQPSARLYCGVLPGVGEAELRRALAEGRVEQALLPLPVRPGDFVYLPAGTLHAAAGGLLLAEIQQASDTTLRLFDWNPVGLDGKPRPLHVEQALRAVRFEQRGRIAHAPPPSGRPGVRCPAFTFERVSVAPGGAVPLEAGRPRILCGVEGTGEFADTAGRVVPLRPGSTCLVPACGAGHLTSGAGGVFLLVRV